MGLKSGGLRNAIFATQRHHHPSFYHHEMLISCPLRSPQGNSSVEVQMLSATSSFRHVPFVLYSLTLPS